MMVRRDRAVTAGLTRRQARARRQCGRRAPDTRGQTRRLRSELPSEAKKPDAPTFVREPEARVRGERVAVARERQAVADFSVEKSLRLEVVVRREAVRVPERLRAFHPAGRHPPGRSQHERDAKSGGSRVDPDCAGCAPFLEVAVRVCDRGPGGALDGYTLPSIANSGANFQAVSASPLSLRTPDSTKGISVPPAPNSNVREPSRMRRNRLDPASVGTVCGVLA